MNLRRAARSDNKDAKVLSACRGTTQRSDFEHTGTPKDLRVAVSRQDPSEYLRMTVDSFGNSFQDNKKLRDIIANGKNS
jgi:hypothetical protein